MHRVPPQSRDAFNASTRETIPETVDVTYRAEIYHDVGRPVLVYFLQNGLAKLSRVCKIDISREIEDRDFVVATTGNLHGVSCTVGAVLITEHAPA